MANTALFGNRIPPACRYCENIYSHSLRDETVLCKKKGVVAAGYRCRLYRYDPLKRIPKQSMEQQQFKESDFFV